MHTHRASDPVGGPFEVWCQLVEVKNHRVRFEIHYVLSDTDEELISTNELRFVAEHELTASLTAAGFHVEHVFGDWDREPVGVGTPESIYVAVRAEQE